ncbi:hypothetical protein C8J55DRAFT_566099 [Lentinula edodes]|uniref:Uncharacterized protein n=1 Tax=Lentinula lateritia TaxID=40482 RepID=A0A9W8ZSI1_9AGAR|nr:hypothetical protein C8J55DRAFT_566099 [Lentinula edodes]
MSTTSSTTPSSTSSSTNHRPTRPSPRNVAAMLETPNAAIIQSGGLKARLRRALTFNAQQQAFKEEDDNYALIKASALG